MFRPLRRVNNQISIEETKNILRNARYGFLAVNGDDGYPYCLPLNYLYDEQSNAIYFHGASAGHKADALNNCDKVCFTVTGKEEVLDEPWAPYVSSAIVFGKCHKISDKQEILKLINKLAQKYYPSQTQIDENINNSGNVVCIYKINIEHISGKKVQEK